MLMAPLVFCCALGPTDDNQTMLRLIFGVVPVVAIALHMLIRATLVVVVLRVVCVVVVLEAKHGRRISSITLGAIVALIRRGVKLMVADDGVVNVTVVVLMMIVMRVWVMLWPANRFWLLL